MATSNRQTSRAKSTLLDDLDLQPVREVRSRVLNEVPPEDESAPSSPKVKFNYVNVTLPKPSKNTNDYERSEERCHISKGSKQDMDTQKNRQRKAQSLQTNVDENRRQFASRMLSRGVPVWEEVSEEERSTRFLGGNNPFQYRSGSRDLANITSRNSYKKSSKVPSAVWEDVSKVSSISQSIPREDDFFSDGSNESVIKIDSKGGSNTSHKSHIHSSLHGDIQDPHKDQTQFQFSGQQEDIQSNSHCFQTLHSPSQCSNTHDNTPAQDPAPAPINETVVLDQEPSHAIPEQLDGAYENVSGMKRKFGGQIEENGGAVITTKSWRIGERLARQRYGPLPQVLDDKNEKDKGEEEKHERESTRESRNKRDLSVSSRVETQPSKSRQKMTTKDEDKVQPAPKTPPRIRSYKPEEVQKYMESKRTERLKSLKQQKVQKQLEKVKREERLKELAVKTKELAQTNKIQQATDHKKNQGTILKDFHNDNPHWGCASDCEHEIAPKSNLKPDELLQSTANSNEMSSRKGSSEKIKEISVSEKAEVERAVTKTSKKDGKKRKKKRISSLSDSDSISEIVSRTIKDCEKQVRSSSISLESISSTSVSLSSSDSEMKSSESQSSTSSFDFQPKQRVVSLGQMAQNLTSRIEREEENLKIHAGTKKDGRQDVASHQAKVPKPAVKEIGPRETLSYSEIQALSVDDLIARMTAMLPQNAARIPARADPTTSRHTDVLGRSTQTAMTPQLLHQSLRQNQQSQQQMLTSKPAASRTEDIPDLMPPEIPTLQLSGSNTTKILHHNSIPEPKVNTLLSLAGASIPLVNAQNILKTTENSPVHFTRDTTQNFAEVTESQMYGRKKMMEKAALKIQSVYRGYCVRKITSGILGKKFGRTVHKPRAEFRRNVMDQVTRHPKVPQQKFFKKKDLHMTSSSDECNEVDWRKIRTELENKSYVPKREVPYVFKKADLPEWIKPYVILSETGNIDNFIDSRVREPQAAEQEAGARELIDPPLNNDASNDSDKENIEILDNVDLDATLTEGPISDADKKDVYSMHEKETQTKGDVTKTEKRKKEKSKDQKNHKLIKQHDKNMFVDLKKTFTGEKTLLLNNVEINVNKEISGEAVAIKSRPFSSVLKHNDPEKTKALKSQLNNSEKHEVTLESGLLEEESLEQAVRLEPLVSSTDSDGDFEVNIEEGEILESSEVIDSQISDLSADDRKAPHQLLGRGPHIGPASLRLRLNAELMYQDTLGEALSQLRDAEQLQILSKTSQEAIAYSQSLAQEHQERLAEEQRKKEEEMKKVAEKKKDEGMRRKKEEEDKKLKEDQKRHQEALLSVERMEKEARDRLSQLEKEVRARAEQIFSSTTQMAPQATSSQPDVIAAAAVAAVGATISQWERMRPVRGGSTSGLESNAVILSQGPISSSLRDSHNYSSTFTGSSADRSRSRASRSEKYSSSSRSTSSRNKKSSVSERISVVSADRSKSSVIEDLPSSIHSASSRKSSVEEQFSSEAESSRKSSLSEEVDTEMSVPTVGQRKSSQSQLSVPEEDLRGTSTSEERSVSEEMYNNVQSSRGSKSVSETSISTQLSRKSGTVKSSNTEKQSSNVSEDIPKSRSGSQEVMEEVAGSSANITSNLTSSTVKESLLSKSVTSLSEVLSKDPSYNGTSEVQESIVTSERTRDSATISKTKSTSTSASKSQAESTPNESKEKGDIYSESFEVDESGSESSSSSAVIPSPSRKLRDYNGDLSIMVTSANILTAVDQIDYTSGGGLSSGMMAGGSSSALGMTLNIMESMQKEEELRHQHQKALLKLQEQSLIEEARWKLEALQSEGGPGIRKKQRAVLLQLREQRAHLRRLIETQNLAAQQRRLLLLQHYHLLATTNGGAALGGRGFATTSRGQSPTSSRLTPRMMEVNISSSSESQDDISLHLSVKGKDAGSSSPSDGGGREKRRSHSEERKRISSVRLQEKRRAEMDLLQQQLLQEEKEILRLKNQDKDVGKGKRKGEIGNQRSRDKREKSPTSSAQLSGLVQDSVSSAGSSVPEESVDASAHDSQSSMPEDGGCQSDAGSSISEQEVRCSRSMSSVPVEISNASKQQSQAGSIQSSTAHTVTSAADSSHISEDVRDSSVSKHTKSTENKPVHQSASADSKNSRSSEKSSSIRTVTSDSYSKITERNTSERLENEKNSKTSEAQSTIKSGSLVSEIQNQSRTDCAVSENVSKDSKTPTVSASSRTGNELSHASEARSGEGRSSSQKVSLSRALPLPLRVPLSPRSPHRHHRRYSSESDDSFTLSQTETASDVSDGEGKLLALKEQLASRRAEAERLRREKRRLKRECLASQEHALKKQISAYDSYIQQTRMDLEKESKKLQQASMVRPLIKKPQVAETKKSRQSESILISPDKSDISETSILSESARSEQSDKSSSRSKEEIISKTSSPSSISPRESDSAQKPELQITAERAHSPVAPEVTEQETNKSLAPEPVAQDPHEDAEPSRLSHSSSISEDYSFEEETTTSEHSNDCSSPHKSLSQDSSQDTDHSPSRASSTETIVQSPKKQDSGQKDEEESIASEISGLEAPESLTGSEDASKGVNLKLLDEMKGKEADNDSICRKQESRPEIAGTTENEIPNVVAESEKKLDIYIPIPDLRSQEGYESSDQDKDTSMEGSIGEEVVDEHYEESTSEISLPIPVTLQEVDQEKETEDHSSSHKAVKDVSEQEKATVSEARQKAEVKEEAQAVEDDESQAHSLRTQRLVDDISNNLLASMMKETSQLFTSILRRRNANQNDSDLKAPVNHAPQESPLKSGLPSESENKTDQSSDSQILADDPPTTSLSISKSQILKRVNDLIAEGNMSPRAPSVLSPRQTELVLTPQLTFDLSPDILSPASSTPASPTKVSAGLDSRLPDQSASLVNKTSMHESDERESSLSPESNKANNLDMAALTSKLLNIANSPELDLEDKLGQIDGEDTEFSVEGIEGNWFDDDFWTSADNRKKQQQLKAEEERIAAEIARLEELQRLQEQYPGLVIREVPNKPPPPYTPPNSLPGLSSTSPPLSPTMPPAYSIATPRGEEKPAKEPTPANTISVPHRLSKADLRKLATEIFHVVPSRKEEVIPLVKDAFECLYESWERGLDPALVEPSEKFVSPSPVPSQNEDSSEEEEEGSARIFRNLLFCLVREIVSDAYQQQHVTVPPPWIKQSFPPTKILLAVRTNSKSALYAYAQDKVRVLFGWSPTAQKESLMIRWARKHRDLVDQVLVRELQAEESSWTRYDEDEAAVKVQVASEIMEDLILDTVTVFSEIIAKKRTFI